MNLHKFQYFTYVYFITLMFTILISVFIKKYDFLLGIYIFTIPILVVGFITIWFHSNKTVPEKLTNDILLHWIPFLSFMFILFVIQPQVKNKIWFWIGYCFIIISSIIYFLLTGGKQGIKKNYNLKFLNIIIIYNCCIIIINYIYLLQIII